MNLYLKYLPTALLLCLHLSASTQNFSSADIQNLIKRARKKFQIPAIAITVMSADSIYIREITGNRVSGSPTPATLNDYFHIGSCSKSVLAIIAARLIEEEKISWHTPFLVIFPELKRNALPDYTEITLEDLFLCRAGIQAFTSAKESLPEFGPDVQNKRLVFAEQLLNKAPASTRKKDGKFAHVYSNASFTMAALMLERVSRRTYEELIAHYIRQTLGFDIFIGFPNTFHPDQPWGHLISGKEESKFPPDHIYKIPYLLIPAGDLSMPPMDFAAYIQLHLEGLRGVDRFISSKSWHHIHFGHKEFSLGVGNGVWRGHAFSGLDGTAGTFFCRAILVPDSDFAFTIMTNAGSGKGHMKAIEWLSRKIVKKHY